MNGERGKRGGRRPDSFINGGRESGAGGAGGAGVGSESKGKWMVKVLRV